MIAMRRFFAVLFFCTSFFLLPSFVFGAGEFTTSYEIVYQLNPDQTVSVDHQINLVNQTASTYLTAYQLEMEGVEVDNLTAQDSGGVIQPTVNKENGVLKINLQLNQKVVGEGKESSFKLNYQVTNLLVKNGEVWEINLPRPPATEGSTGGKVTLIVPHSFGPLAYVSPSLFEASRDENFRYYFFNKNQVEINQVSAAFGEFQIFDFKLAYHLHNPHSGKGETEVAFPPDTAFQRVYYQAIEPAPLSMRIDSDGNWLGLYRLEPNQKIEINATGFVKIFSEAQTAYFKPTPENLTENLKPQEYWEVSDPEILLLAQELKTVEEIYDFVVGTLDYDYSKVNESAQRKGAVEALMAPDQAVCMEFTDLFISLARAAGIPARGVDGYAYTTNSKLRPLGLLVDVLHAWPEYWDQERQLWVPVDPTWEKTTGGRDYFSRFDLNHFVFAIHGQDPEEPYPAGSYKTGTETKKDIEISFGQYQPPDEAELNVSFVLPSGLSSSQEAKLIIQNLSAQAFYDLPLELGSETVEYQPGFTRLPIIEILPPYGQAEISLKLARTGFFEFGPAKLKVKIQNREYKYSFRVESLTWPRYFIFLLSAGIGVGWFFVLKKARVRFKKEKPRIGLTV